MNLEERKSVCPFDCPDTCGLLVEIEKGRAVKIKGDPEHPFTRGTLCPKMLNYERTVYSPDRLTTPLIRTGPKGSNSFAKISWTKAIEKIKERWQDIINQYGAEAILPYSYAGTMGILQRNCGEAFFYRLGASRLDRTICSSAKGYGWAAVMGGTLAPHPDEVLESDLIILWGTNAAATNIHFLQNVRQAKKKGAQVWLIETHKTPTAAAADRVFLVKPGSDGALALGMMHIIERDKLQDQEFIDTYVLGYEEFRDRLAKYSPKIVSELTGLSEDQIEELAHLYAGARAPFISLGTGLSRYGNGAMTVRCITCLPAVIGAWRKVGGGLFANIATGGAFAGNIITREDFITKETRLINMNQLGEALTKADDPPIMGLYVYHSNPASIAPDQNMVINGLMREDLFTVVHERFMTDTALYADIILPATTSLEHSDIYRSYGHYCLQRAFPVIEPVGEAKSNWEVFSLLAKAMGFTENYFNQSADQLVEQLIDTPNAWLQQANLSDLKNGKTVELPLPKDYKLKYNTPTGKIEILSLREDKFLPEYFPPHGDEQPYWFMNAPSLYSLNSTFNEQPELVRKKGEMYLFMNPADAMDRALSDGQQVTAYNERGEVDFILKISSSAPQGVVFSEGVSWIRDCPGSRSVNALTSQRLTDRANGSTFYDTKVNVRSK